MKKFRMTLPVMALLVAVSASAFTTIKKPALVDYFYNSSSTAPADILTAAKYSPGTSGSCNGGTAMPCNIEFDNSVYPTVQAWLTHEGTASKVIADATATKH